MTLGEQHQYAWLGTPAELMDEAGISARHIVAAVEALVARREKLRKDSLVGERR
jgi:hypothetical protein